MRLLADENFHRSITHELLHQHPGLDIEISQEAPIGAVIADLLLLIGASRPDEWAGQVLYVPL